MEYLMTVDNLNHVNYIYDDRDKSVRYNYLGVGRVGARFRNTDKLLKLDDNQSDIAKFRMIIGNHDFQLCSYRLNTTNAGTVSVEMYLTLNDSGVISAVFYVSLSDVAVSSYLMAQRKGILYGFSIQSTSFVRDFVCSIPIPCKMALYLMNLKSRYDISLLHQFDSLMCRNMARIFDKLNVCGVDRYEI